MKNTIKCYSAILTFCLYLGANDLLCQVREIINLNDSWKFTLSDDPNSFKSDYNDAGWTNVTVPHTWNNIMGQGGDDTYYRGAGWYRKSILINESPEKRIFLKFNSANLVSDVYFNDSLLGSHIGGYSAFIFDVTRFVKQNQNNMMAVRVNNSNSLKFAPISADFNFCGGITRSVELWITNNILVSPLDYASSGVYITPVVTPANNADINIKIVLTNFSEQNTAISENYSVIDACNHVIKSYSTNNILLSKADTVVSRCLSINNPILWDGLKNPYLYTLEVSLKVNNVIVDEVKEKFGIRYLAATTDSGIYLNGKRYPLHGIAFHEDRKNKGRAISDNDRKEDLSILSETGLNYLRLSHYQHGQYTYRYCDSTGIVLWTEIPLINEIDTSGPAFSENIKEQLKELIKQNYNHPSICFWGLYNEIYTSPNPTQLVVELNSLAKSLDNTRFTVAANNRNGIPNKVPDLISFNLYLGWYHDSIIDINTSLDNQHIWLPKSCIGLSEYGAGASIYHHEENPAKPVANGEFHPEEYQNLFHEVHWKAIKERPFVWESSVWLGFDFASYRRSEGDLKGINDKGLVTRDRLTKKDAYFFYKANWNPQPMVYISSRRFVQRDTSLVEVKVYSNIDTVALFVNGIQYPKIISDEVVKKWNLVSLNRGNNKILAIGIHNGDRVKDSCNWINNDTCNNNISDTILPGDIQINFQPNTVQPPEGYIADYGDAYGNRGNEYSYGWNISNADDARYRGSSGDLRYYTFNHMQRNNTNKTWEIALENGTYRISLACGDPAYIDSKHSIRIEDQNVLYGIPSSTDKFINRTFTVIVADGKLTVSPDTNSINAKINFIHISMIAPADTFIEPDTVIVPDTTIVPGDIQINFQPNTIQPPVNYIADYGDVFGSRGNGYSYGWNISNTGDARYRGSSGERRYYTFNHMQRNNTNKTWEIDLENGIYRVSLACGDPTYIDSKHSILLEGKNVLYGVPSSTNKFINRTVTVILADGKLTVSPDTNSVNAKINFIHISRIDLPDNMNVPVDTQISWQPNNLKIPKCYIIERDEVFYNCEIGYRME